jgi:hypothetical protein
MTCHSTCLFGSLRINDAVSTTFCVCRKYERGNLLGFEKNFDFKFSYLTLQSAVVPTCTTRFNITGTMYFAHTVYSYVS